MLSSSTGFCNLDDTGEVVKLLVYFAEKSPVLSFRGTAFYVLGLLADVPEVREVIESCNWEPNEGPSFICFPRNLSESGLFRVESPTSDHPPQVEPNHILWDTEQMTSHNNAVQKEDPLQKEVDFVSLTGKLLNRVAGSQVRTLYKKYVEMVESPEAHTETLPKGLKDPHVLHQVYKILGNFKIDLKNRRLIHKIFREVNLEELLEELDKQPERKT